MRGSIGTVLTAPSAAWAGPCTASVTPHQPISTAAMIVVTIMIFRALSLDSWMPRTFWRKKYSVAAQATATDPHASHGLAKTWAALMAAWLASVSEP